MTGGRKKILLWLFYTCSVIGLIVWSATRSRRLEPREQFQAELTKKLDKLSQALRALRPDESTWKEKVMVRRGGNGSDSKVEESTAELPIAFAIIDSARSIAAQFNEARPELMDDPQGLDEWSRALKENFWEKLREVDEEIQRIKREYQEGMRGERKFFGVPKGKYNPFATSLTPSVGLTHDGDLYFTYNGERGYVVGEMLRIDFNKWLAVIKSPTSQESSRAK